MGDEPKPMTRHFMQVVSHASRVFRYLWASPYSLVGLLLSAIALMLGATARVSDGALETAGGRFGVWLSRFPRALRFSAVTLGHVILAESEAVLASVSAHEHVHVRQYERWGILFVPVYFGSSLVQLGRGRSPHRANRFEREAYGIAEPATALTASKAARPAPASPRRPKPGVE